MFIDGKYVWRVVNEIMAGLLNRSIGGEQSLVGLGCILEQVSKSDNGCKYLIYGIEVGGGLVSSSLILSWL
jgi:hypothetical protein